MSDTKNHIFKTGLFQGPFKTLSPEATAISIQARDLTDKEKVEEWFINPLTAMKGDEGLVCLMVCFPLLEAILRLELSIPDAQDLSLPANLPALHKFSKFMSLPERAALDVWDAFRNGLLHRGMVKSSLQYELTGEMPGRVATLHNGVVTVYVWEFRDAIVNKLRTHHVRLWKYTSSRLPIITTRWGG